MLLLLVLLWYWDSLLVRCLHAVRIMMRLIIIPIIRIGGEEMELVNGKSPL